MIPRIDSALSGVCRSALMRKRWTLLAALITLALSLPNWRICLMSMDAWPMAKAVAQLAIIALTALFGLVPSVASALLLAAYAVDVWIPYPYLEANGWCLLLALGYVAFRARPAVAAVVFVFLCGMQYVELAKMGVTVTITAMTSLCGSYAAALAIGMLLRRQQELERLRRQALRIRQFERNLDVAHRLHDATSGELTSISLTAQLCARRTDDAGQRELLDRIIGQSNRALDHVHDIIRLLTDERDRSASEASPNRTDKPASSEERLSPDPHTPAWDDIDLRGFAARMDRKLHEAGFAGSVIVDDAAAAAADRLDGDRKDLLAALLRETVANIIRHGDRADPRYTLHITLTERGIDVMQSNPASSPPQDAAPAGERSDATHPLPDHGLALLRHRIIARSGVMATTLEHGVWRLHASIPTTERR